MATIEEKFYGAAPATEPVAAPDSRSPRSDQELVDRFWGGPDSQKLAAQPAFDARREDHAVKLGRAAPAQAALEAEHVAMVGEAGFDPYTLGQRLWHARTDADLADRKRTDDVATGEDDAEMDRRILEHNERIRGELRATYGPNRADELQVLGRRFIKAHPRLAALMTRRGLASDPEIVRAILAHIHRVNWR